MDSILFPRSTMPTNAQEAWLVAFWDGSLSDYSVVGNVCWECVGEQSNHWVDVRLLPG